MFEQVLSHVFNGKVDHTTILPILTAITNLVVFITSISISILNSKTINVRMNSFIFY